MENVFKLDGGCLEHYIDRELRAIVPAESFTAYGEDWPDAAAFLAAHQPAAPAAAEQPTT